MHDILWYHEDLWSFWESHPWWCELQIANWNRTAQVEMKERHCKSLPSAKQCQNAIQRRLQRFLLFSIIPTTDAAMWINAITDLINLWLFASWISWRHIVAKWLAQGQIRIEAWHRIFKSDFHLAGKSQGDFIPKYISWPAEHHESCTAEHVSAIVYHAQVSSGMWKVLSL